MNRSLRCNCLRSRRSRHFFLQVLDLSLQLDSKLVEGGAFPVGVEDFLHNFAIVSECFLDNLSELALLTKDVVEGISKLSQGRVKLVAEPGLKQVELFLDIIYSLCCAHNAGGHYADFDGPLEGYDSVLRRLIPEE